VDFTHDVLKADDDPYGDDNYRNSSDDDDSLIADSSSDEEEDDTYSEEGKVDDDAGFIATRSVRKSTPTRRMNQYKEAQQHVLSQYAIKHQEYNTHEALAYALVIMQLREREIAYAKHATQHVITYSLKKGMEKFSDKARNATLDEMKQLVDRVAFTPVDVSSLRRNAEKLLNLYFFDRKKRWRSQGKTLRKW
jgi:uncharacterized protein YdhG (YjbR/CyaY superfamily)